MGDVTPGRERVVTIPRWQAYRVIDMPGLVRIDLPTFDSAQLVFTTAPGCEAVDDDFLVGEVGRMGAHVIGITRAARS